MLSVLTKSIFATIISFPSILGLSGFDNYVFPIDGGTYHYERGFGYQDHPVYHTKKKHTGVDLSAKRGTGVLNISDGVVSFVSSHFYGYGVCVEVTHTNGVVTRYAHLEKALVKKGDVLCAGTKIGLVGSSGTATGPHLHLEFLVENKPVDPALFFTFQK